MYMNLIGGRKKLLKILPLPSFQFSIGLEGAYLIKIKPYGAVGG